ncbi:MAG: tetratricopeptide repeat protein [Deltaproteobacteria bacterium]|jgi:tetratricopeptide (TPR) repeat protein|nr:tetratricopeptide repeat protein [Deltaproteobacteria bacterium]
MTYNPQWAVTFSAPGSREEDIAADLRERGDLAGAEAAVRKALESLARKGGAGIAGYLPLLDSLALTLMVAGRLAEAVGTLEEALAVSEQALGESHKDTLTRASNLGLACSSLGERERAVERLRKVRDLQTRLLGPGDRETLSAEGNLAVAMSKDVPVAETVAAFERILAGMERVMPEDSVQVRMARHNVDEARKLLSLM